MSSIRDAMCPALLAALLAPCPAAAQDGETGVEAGVKMKAAAYDEGARDLGMTPPEGTAPAEEREATYLDLGPWLRSQFTEESALFFRGQLFAAAGDPVVQNEDELPVASERYFALREAWLEYGGITSFPGEVLRLGLQRVREPDGLWWDRDVESVRWIFDTTLLQAQLGVAEQFNTYRSDDVELSPSQRDRAYVFASLNRQWRPGYFHGVRAAFAQDHGELPDPGTTADATSKMHERSYLWVALHTDNGFYDPRNDLLLTYWFEAIALAGRRDSAQTAGPAEPTEPGPAPEPEPADPNTVTHVDRTEVAALAGDAGLRFRLPLIVPVNLGGMAAFAQGERAGNVSHVFTQTGLESNRSRFTGTRTLINRFNEALAADWSNLLASSAFVSLPHEQTDLSVIYHRFRRHDGTTAFTADGIDARPVNDSRDIGSGVDFVLTWFFRGFESRPGARDDDDPRSNLRLRASRFEPGAAYGSSLEDQNLGTLELTLWF